MTPTTTVGDWAGDRLAHEAVVFDRDNQVRARVLPFVQEGLDRGEPMCLCRVRLRQQYNRPFPSNSRSLSHRVRQGRAVYLAMAA